MLPEVILVIAMALTPPVVSSLVIVHAMKEGRSIVAAISAVAAAWTLSNAMLPPIRSIVFAFGASSSCGVGCVAALCVASLSLTLITPPWIFSERPWIDESSDIKPWLTFVTRVAATLSLASSLFSIQFVLASVISELVSSGLIIYLVIPGEAPSLSSAILSRVASHSISAFLEAPEKIASDALQLPGLAFCIMMQIAAMTINFSSALYRALDQDQEEKVDHAHRNDD